MPETEFLVMLREAGFTNVEGLGPTGFASSPSTMGMRFKAEKP